MCCIDECERLLGKLEREIGAPASTPAQNAQLAENLPSDTVEAPRVLSGALWRRLTELAERHEGAVPLHTRLFAQWMHHSYPRECVFPYVSGVSGPVSADEWMPEGERHATEEEMRQAIDETASKTDSKSTDSEAVEEPGTSEEVELMWTEQELFVVRMKSSVESGVFRQCGSLRCPCRGPLRRGVAYCKTLDRVEVHSVLCTGEGLVQVCVKTLAIP